MVKVLELWSRIGQRHLLAVMCMFGLMFTNMLRLSFTLVMRDMFYVPKTPVTYPRCVNDSTKHQFVGTEEFLWGNALQYHVHGGWMYGTLLGVVPWALLTDKTGAKTHFGYSLLVPGVCSALVPICARSSPYILIGNRILSGFMTSGQQLAIGWMAARWFPPSETGRLIAITYVAIPLALILTFFINHLIHQGVDWTVVCYSNAVLSLAFAYLWQALTWDEPFDHPRITDAELHLLVERIPMYADESELEPGWKWPWLAMLKSRSMWLLMIAHVGSECTWAFAIYKIALSYLRDVQGFDFTLGSGLAECWGLLVFSVLGIGVFAAGVFQDWAIFSRRWLNITQVLKTYYLITSVIGSLLLAWLTHSGCNFSMAIVLFTLAIFCQGISFSNWPVACLHMAPNFVATVMAVSSIMKDIAKPVLFKLEDLIVDKDSTFEWPTAAYLNAVVSIVTTTIFLQCGIIEPQPWNQPDKKAVKIDDSSISYPSSFQFKKGFKRASKASPSTATVPGDSKGVEKVLSSHSQNQELV